MATIVFDLDDTLIVEEASAQTAFLSACEVAEQRCGINAQSLYVSIRECCRARWHHSPARPYCIQVGISSWEGLWAEFYGDDPNLQLLREWSSEYRERSWYDALCRCGLNDSLLASQLSETYVEERRKLHILYSDVLSVLICTRESHRLGLLTNGAPDLQRRKIESAGLADFFDSIVISGEVGLGKPDIKIFNLILTKLDTTADDAIMIGNSLLSDIQPAQTIGMTGVWLNREGKTRDEPVVPDFELTSLTDLKDLFPLTRSHPAMT